VLTGLTPSPAPRALGAAPALYLHAADVAAAQPQHGGERRAGSGAGGGLIDRPQVLRRPERGINEVRQAGANFSAVSPRWSTILLYVATVLPNVFTVRRPAHRHDGRN
jgi:hypothetical protein